MFRVILFSIILGTVFSGCNKWEEGCTYEECAVKAPADQEQAVQDYLNSQGITNAVKHCSGLYYVIDEPGTGGTPEGCSAVDVTYTGSLTNGTVFDSGPTQLSLGSVIRGWRNGLPLIKEGGKIRLFIPPALGYGDQPNGPIPEKSILIFSIELNALL
jgi:FKBP-type peptidyl-prolyl cis-trans isomerase FkpA